MGKLFFSFFYCNYIQYILLLFYRSLYVLVLVGMYTTLFLWEK